MAHVPHLFLPPPWDASAIALADEHVHHLRRVLRMADGGVVSYTDGGGVAGEGRFVDGRVERGDEIGVPRPNRLTVVVAPPANRDRLRFLVEKLAELGVQRLLWCRTSRTEGRAPNPDKARAWATGALEQSRGAWLLDLGTTRLEDLDPADLVVADPTGVSEPPPGRLTILIGPEGGLAADEIPPGAALFSLGPTVLRIETAAIVGAVAVKTAGLPPGH